MGELYGEYNLMTNEWTDGLGSTLIRNAVADVTPDKKWVVSDGPAGAQALAAALPSLPALRELYLGGNALGGEVVRDRGLQPPREVRLRQRTRARGRGARLVARRRRRLGLLGRAAVEARPRWRRAGGGLLGAVRGCGRSRPDYRGRSRGDALRPRSRPPRTALHPA